MVEGKFIDNLSGYNGMLNTDHEDQCYIWQ